MANMIVASSKPLIRATSSPIPPKPRFQIPQFSIPKLPTSQISLKSDKVLTFTSKTLKSLSLFAATALAYIPPSLAEELAAEKEKAELFDFNLTLPIMMAQFLTLMFALDKIYFTPIGKFMDQRDAEIKARLSSVQNNAEEIKELEEKADAVMKAARAEVSAAYSKMQKETQAEVAIMLEEGRKRIEAELAEALANLERQKIETLKALDAQTEELGRQIVKKVLPTADV